MPMPGEMYAMANNYDPSTMKEMVRNKPKVSSKMDCHKNKRKRPRNKNRT